MNEAEPRSPPPPQRRLDSWKEIAAYLNRGVRTVQRWERMAGLPIHRVPHDKKGGVYALSGELDAWWKSGDRRQIKEAGRRRSGRLIAIGIAVLNYEIATLGITRLFQPRPEIRELCHIGRW